MKIIPIRKMLLGGRHVVAGLPVDVPEADGVLALRMGWAKADEAKPAHPAKRKAKDEPAATNAD